MRNLAVYSMGIMNYCSHDPACCLLKVHDNNIEVAYAEEGFLSRKKKSYQFPIRSMKYCLDYFGIKLSDINVLMLDYMDHKRTFKTSNNYRLLIGDFIRSRLRIDSSKIKFVRSHHYAHALTAFWPSPFEEAAVLVVDGLGSQQQTTSIFSFNTKGTNKLLFEQKGNGIGLLYSLITKQLGFGSGEEGKTMGLAPYGALVDKKFDNYLNLKGTRKGCVVDYSHLVDRSPTAKLKVEIKKPTKKTDVYKDYYTKIAFDLQNETEECLTYLALEAVKKAKSSNLCFSGGVALNCVANNKIQNLSEINNFWVQPASGDSGIPIGLALAGLEEIGIDLKTLMSRKNRDVLSSAYSRDHSPLNNLVDLKVKKLLSENNIHIEKFKPEQIAKSLIKKQIVALYYDGIEIGPRALGHRSFLADARTPKMKDILNAKIKHREGYRPFAPIVLKSDFRNYFISSTDDHPYMLQAPRCTNKALNNVPAICHVDGTARVQTITSENGIIFDILESYKEICGESVIINTSFNDNDEPIVFSKIDAICSFLRCNADVLILGEKIIERQKIPDIHNFKNAAEKLQKKIMERFFDDSIKELTKILKKDKAKTLLQFINLNAELSKIHRIDRVISNFIEFLLLRNINKSIFVDNYHFKIINKLINIFGLQKKDICPKIKIIEDNFKSISEIKEDSDFVLYNISAHFLNKYTRNLFNNPDSLVSFYKLSDYKINLENFDSKEKFFVKKNKEVVDYIKNTYEHNTKVSIDKFFRDFIKY